MQTQKNLSFSLIFILILFLLITITSSNDCTINDFQKTLSSCNTTTNKRSLTLDLINECTFSNATLQSYIDDFFLEIDCNTHCPPGHYLYFSESSDKASCQKCPPNTFSPGHDLNIHTWSEEFLQFFSFQCKTKNEMNKMKNIPCNKIDYDNNNIVFNIDDNFVDTYSLIIEFEFNAIDMGNIIFEYFVEGINDHNKEGEIIFGIEFDEIQMKENEGNNGTKIINYSYREGFHILTINFTYVNKDKTNSKRELPSLILKSFKAFNVFDINLDCLQCNQPHQYEGSIYCLGSYSPSNKEDTNEQFPSSSSNCSVFDYSIKNVNEFCNENGHNVSFYRTQHQFSKCVNIDNLNIKFNINDTNITCLQKIDFTKMNNTIRCPYNRYISFSLDMIHNFYMEHSYLSHFNTDIDDDVKWINNGISLYIPQYASVNKYVFVKMVNVVSYKGKFIVDFVLDLVNNDELYMMINGKRTNITKSQIFLTELDTGLNEIKIIFQRRTPINEIIANVSIPAKITYMEINGIDETNKLRSFQCIKCPDNFITSPLNRYTCIPETYNYIQQNNNSEMKKINDSQDIFNDTHCPSFTNQKVYYMINQKNERVAIKSCELSKVFEYLPEKIKYNFTTYTQLLKENLKKYDKLFSAKLNIDSYSENEIIPLLFNNNNDNNNIKLYYSLFKPITFHFSSSYSTFGYIFGISEQANYTQQQYVTLARNISQVKIIKNRKINNGFIVIYDKGDICLNNKNKRYQTATIFKCDKTKSGLTLPYIYKISEDKCTIITEISSKYFCKQCLSSEISQSKGNCLRNSSKRDVVNLEKNDCIFIPYLDENVNYLKINKQSDELFFTADDNLFPMVGYKKEEFKLSNIKELQILKRNGKYVKFKRENEKCIMLLEMNNLQLIGMVVCFGFYFVTICVIIALLCKYCSVVSESKLTRKEDEIQHKVEIK